MSRKTITTNDLKFDPTYYKPRKLTEANVRAGNEVWWSFCNNTPDKMLRRLDSLEGEELAMIRGEVLAVITGQDVFRTVIAEQDEWATCWVESVAPGILWRARLMNEMLQHS